MVKPRFVHKYPHYDFKLHRALHHATDGNPKQLEAPYYEVYNLVLNDLILDERDYSCCPQGVLLVHMEEVRRKKPEIVKRFPDFIIYHERGNEVEGDVWGTRLVAFIAEIKPWRFKTGDVSDHDVISDHFN